MEVLTILPKKIKKIRKEKGKSRVAGDSDKIPIERTTRKCFRCGSEDRLISICLKSNNKKGQKQVHFSERGNRTSQKEFKKLIMTMIKNIYTYIYHMSDNKESPVRHFGDSSQLTNWILDSGTMCHMTQQVSGFIPS